jgi:hypothetical protein
LFGVDVDVWDAGEVTIEAKFNMLVHRFKVLNGFSMLIAWILDNPGGNQI